MNHPWRRAAQFLNCLFLLISLCACGSQPWRFNAGAAQKPSGVVATAGDGKVSLTWPAAQGAASYNVYFATSPGVSAASATRITGATGTAATVSGLTNGTRYYFAVSSVNSAGESPLSEEVSAIPSPPGAFQQSDLQGTWRFNALVSGANARWMRGTVTVDAAGIVSATSYLDSAGATAAPAGLFGTLTIFPDGVVLQNGGAADFHGALCANLFKDLLVATATSGANSRMMLILQKVVPGITFSPVDIQGTGRAGAGPLPGVYHQVSSGAVSAWEYASLQVGRDQGVTYLSLNSSTQRPLPGGGGKVVTLSITPDGIVSDTPNPGVLPQPAALFNWGVMSADKMTVVGTATDAHGSFLLRVLQLVHPPTIALTPSSYLLSGLAGNYRYHALESGTAPAWVTGSQSVDGSGAFSFTSFLDSDGGTVLPGPVTAVMDQQGMLTVSFDPTWNGQLSYLHDMVVSTRTEPDGRDSLSIAVRGAK